MSDKNNELVALLVLKYTDNRINILVNKRIYNNLEKFFHRIIVPGFQLIDLKYSTIDISSSILPRYFQSEQTSISYQNRLRSVLPDNSERYIKEVIKSRSLYRIPKQDITTNLQLAESLYLNIDSLVDHPDNYNNSTNPYIYRDEHFTVDYYIYTILNIENSISLRFLNNNLNPNLISFMLPIKLTLVEYGSIGRVNPKPVVYFRTYHKKANQYYIDLESIMYDSISEILKFIPLVNSDPREDIYLEIPKLSYPQRMSVLKTVLDKYNNLRDTVIYLDDIGLFYFEYLDKIIEDIYNLNEIQYEGHIREDMKYTDSETLSSLRLKFSYRINTLSEIIDNNLKKYLDSTTSNDLEATARLHNDLVDERDSQLKLFNLAVKSIDNTGIQSIKVSHNDSLVLLTLLDGISLNEYEELTILKDYDVCIHVTDEFIQKESAYSKYTGFSITDENQSYLIIFVKKGYSCPIFTRGEVYIPYIPISQFLKEFTKDILNVGLDIFGEIYILSEGGYVNSRPKESYSITLIECIYKLNLKYI